MQAFVLRLFGEERYLKGFRDMLMPGFLSSNCYYYGESPFV